MPPSSMRAARVSSGGTVSSGGSDDCSAASRSLNATVSATESAP